MPINKSLMFIKRSQFWGIHLLVVKRKLPALSGTSLETVEPRP